MKSVYDIVIRPIITEQSMEAVEEKKYVFEVARSANKVEIRKAIEDIPYCVLIISMHGLCA